MKVSNFISEQDLDNIKKTGIYKISVNYKNTEELYIGSTSVNFIARWRSHICLLKKQTHENPILQRIVNKHGLGSLVFEIIEIINNNEILLKREQYWIDHHDSYNKGYNCTPFAKSTLGRPMSQKTKEKKYKQVSQYDLDGFFINTFKSMKLAAEETNTSYSTISNVCNFQYETKTANGFQWRFGKDKNSIRPVRVNCCTAVGQYDNDGNLINKFLSIKDAAKFNNRKQNTMGFAIANSSKSNGYYWRKLN